jgi:hypothetical protein
MFLLSLEAVVQRGNKMFQVYLTKAAQDSMSREDLYLLTQTMRISNSLKLFVLVAEDIKNKGPKDVVNNKKYLEMLFYQAANLYEVLVVLKADMIPRYKSKITDANTLTSLHEWDNRLESKEEAVEILKTIRNKHTFHVAYDPYYVWNYISDKPAAKDILIGVGETIQGSGWFFTSDVDILFSHINDHFLHKEPTSTDVYTRVKQIIDETSLALTKLISALLNELLRDRIRIIGDKQVASRKYGEEVIQEGT